MLGVAQRCLSPTKGNMALLASAVRPHPRGSGQVSLLVSAQGFCSFRLEENPLLPPGLRRLSKFLIETRVF